MIKLLSFWLAWRAIRLIAAAAVVIGAVALPALPVNGHAAAAARGEAALTQQRHATHPLEQQLEQTVDKAFKP
jgi:hypothetical protein